MNFVASIMNPIYVLILGALEAHGSGRRPLTPELNKEITCFLIRSPAVFHWLTKQSFILKVIDEA